MAEHGFLAFAARALFGVPWVQEPRDCFLSALDGVVFQQSCLLFYEQKLLLSANWCYSPISGYKGKADVHAHLTQTHWERLQTFSHFNYHNLMSRIHAQKLFMAKDQHIPCKQGPQTLLYALLVCRDKIIIRNMSSECSEVLLLVYFQTTKVCHLVIFIIDSL